MAVQANVTNNQISASVSETKIDVAVSGGVGPTGSPGPQGPAGAAAVSSVNGRTGTVVVTITDLTAASAVHTHSTTDVVSFAAAAAAAAPVQSVAGRTGTVSLAAADVSGLANVAVSGSYTSLSNVPTAFAPATHTHAISEVSGLQTSLDGKASAASTNVSRVETLNGLTGTLSIVAGSNVTVSTAGSSITIAAGGGGGAVSSVNGQAGTVLLTSASVSAASAAHTHTTADITGFATAAAAASPVKSVNGQTGTIVLTAASVTAAGTAHAATHAAGGSDQLFDQALNTASSPIFFGVTMTNDLFVFGGGSNLTIRNSTIDGDCTVVAEAESGKRGRFYGREFAIEDTVGFQIVSLRAPPNLDGNIVVTFPEDGGTVVVLSSTPAHGDTLIWDVSGNKWGLAAQAAGAVASVNGQTGTVTLTTTDLTAASATHTHSASDITSGTLDIARVPTISYTALSNVPASFAPATHTHSTTEIASFTAAVSSAAPVQSVNGSTGVVSLSAASVTAASTSHASTHQAGGADELRPAVTAVSLTASVNNYSLPTGNVLRLSHSGSVSVSITGFGTQADGTLRLLLNVSTSTGASYTIRHQDTNSTAVSRVVVPWAGDYIVSPNGGAALLLYDATDSRWRVV